MEANDGLSKLQEFAKSFQNISIPTIPDYSAICNIRPSIPKIEIDEESTFAYQMQQQTNQILEKSNEQIKLLNEHNERLESNYNKLEELYKLKEDELQESKKETKKSKRLNMAMLIIAILSMLVAIAAWVTPLLMGGAA